MEFSLGGLKLELEFDVYLALQGHLLLCRPQQCQQCPGRSPSPRQDPPRHLSRGFDHRRCAISCGQRELLSRHSLRRHQTGRGAGWSVALRPSLWSPCRSRRLPVGDRPIRRGKRHGRGLRFGMHSSIQRVDHTLSNLYQSRLNQEIAKQGFLPYSRRLSSSKPFGSPLGGLIVHYVPSILVIALPPQGDIYNFILDVEGYPAQILALAITVGLLLLRRREPARLRPFEAWLPAVWLRILVCIALLVAPLIPPPDRKGDVQFFYATYAIVGSGVLLLGGVYWYIWTVLLPRLGGYRLQEAGEVLDDGTKITTLVRV